MRSLILSTALMLGALGITAALPSKAQAQFPAFYNAGYRVGPYGTWGSFGLPRYNFYVNPWGFGNGLWVGPSYQTSFGPYGMNALWATQAYRTLTYNRIWGYNLTFGTPAYLGYNFSPYFGFNSYYRPSVNWSIPLGGGVGAYVPPSFIIR